MEQLKALDEQHMKEQELKKLSEEELQEQIIQQIEVLVDELGGTMCHLTKCTYTGRQVKFCR